MLQDISFISHCSPSLSTSAPPLTVDNVLTAVQGVDWRTLGEVLLPKTFTLDGGGVTWYPELDRIQQQYKSSDDQLHAMVETYVQGYGRDKEPLWRSFIWRLDGGELARVANTIRHFAEPVLGKSCDSIILSTFLHSSYTVYLCASSHEMTPMQACPMHTNLCMTTHIETIVRIYSCYIYSHCVYYYFIDLSQ